MTTFTDPPKAGFRLSQLIYDTRYRSITIQVIAVFLLAFGVYWLVNNTIQNLAALEKNFDFGFLSQPAGYDINQRLVEYTSQSTHGRAAFVGIGNTILIAVLGCALATVLGVIAGVLRLSKNWIVSRLMAVYVEGFRNVPLLLWIIAIFALMTEGMSQPRDFRVGGDASLVLFESTALTNRGIYIPAPAFENALGQVSIFGNVQWPAAQAVSLFGLFSLNLTLIAFLIAIGAGVFAARQVGSRMAASSTGKMLAASIVTFLGPMVVWYLFMGLFGQTSVSAVQMTLSWDYLLLIGLLVVGGIVSGMIKRRADSIQRDTGVRPTTWYLRLGVVLLPFLIALYVLGAHLQYPYLKGFNFTDGIHLRNSLIALLLALSLYTGAFIAEIVRAGILAISKGQSEAAFALGLRPNRTMNLVILPQAMRVIIPPLISQYLNLTKNSSLAIAVGYMDVRSTLGGITINQTGRELEGMLLLGAFYLIVSLVISAVMNVYNNRTQLKER